MFSIVIPTYNNLGYLKLCLKSLINNSKYNHEIIFHINDGSDGTKDFVIKDMIKDIKTLMAEYHEDATVVRNEK